MSGIRKCRVRQRHGPCFECLAICARVHVHVARPASLLSETTLSTPDPLLITHAVAGDRSALTTLLKMYGPTVRGRLSISPTWQGVLDMDAEGYLITAADSKIRTLANLE